MACDVPYPQPTHLQPPPGSRGTCLPCHCHHPQACPRTPFAFLSTVMASSLSTPQCTPRYAAVAGSSGIPSGLRGEEERPEYSASPLWALVPPKPRPADPGQMVALEEQTVVLAHVPCLLKGSLYLPRLCAHIPKLWLCCLLSENSPKAAYFWVSTSRLHRQSSV